MTTHETEPGAAHALLIKHIADLESALTFLDNEVNKRLAKAIADRLEAEAERLGWGHEIEADLDGEMWLAPRDWYEDLGRDDQPEPRAYFTISEENGPGGQFDNTWLAEYLRAGCGAFIALRFEPPLKGAAWKQRLAMHEEQQQGLRKLGFIIKDRAILYPLVLDAAALTEAFASENFEAALQPIAAAVAKAAEAQPYLDPLAAPQ